MMPPASSPLSNEAAQTVTPLTSIPLEQDQDVVLVRQRSRQIAELLGVEVQDQVRIATAASEIAREGLQLPRPVEISLLSDAGRGLLIIRLTSPSATGPVSDFESREGIIAARRLMEQFELQRDARGMHWDFARELSRSRRAAVPLGQVPSIINSSPPRNLYDEFQSQNRELIATLQELRRHQSDLTQANRELEETNRGVVALYAELEEQAESLRRAAEQKTRFYSSISHEFRTPVTSILSLSQILLDRLDGELTSEQDRQVSLIRRCAQNLLEWVNDLLDLARVDAGRMDVRITTFTARDLLTSLRGIMRPLATNERVQLLFEDGLELESIVLCTDEGKLSQILRNLVSNALKFTETGEIRISVRDAGSDNMIAVVVTDTGIGIGVEDQSRIFDEFVQIDNPLQRRAKGTGLGLPLSRRLATLLGGTVDVSSVPGQGSTFRVVIAKRLAAAGDDEKPAPAVAASPSSLHHTVVALIVDDDDASRYLLRQVLTRLPVQVQEASNGQDGLALARKLVPSVIFLDMNMPDTGGFEVLELLRRSPETQEVPVVFYTSQELDIPVEVDSQPPLSFLHKPTGERGLPLEQVRAVLKKVGLEFNLMASSNHE